MAENIMVKKSICIITTIAPTLEQFVIPGARKLKKNNFEVTLMASMNDKFIEKYKDEFSLINIQMERGVKLFGMLKTIWFFYKIFKRERFAIIQYATPNAAFYASVAGWFSGIKVRLYCQWGIRYVGFDGFMRKLFRFIEKITCYLSTAIRPVSVLNLQFAVNEGLYKTSKAKVIGQGGAVGIDLKYFDVSKREQYKAQIIEKHPVLVGKFVFGFVGRLDKDKGINELIGAFRELKVKYTDIALVIVGPLDRLKGINSSLLEYAKKSEDILFIGPSDQIPQYLSAMDILTQPTYREGFGLSMLQAMAMGTAVITTDVPGASETIERDKSGLLCTVRNTDSLLEAMERLLRNNDMKKEFTDKGILRVEEYFTQEQMSCYILADREDIFNKTYKKI